MRSAPVTVLSISVAVVLAASPVAAQSAPAFPSTRDIMVAEDARPMTPEGLRPLLDGIAARDPHIRGTAVRALGRLERPELISYLLPLLTDSAAEVRVMAALAVSMAARDQENGHAADHLRSRLELERTPAVSGALAYALGQLAPPSPAGLETARRLAAVADGSREDLVVLGAARGLEAFSRRAGRIVATDADVTRILHELSLYGRQRSRDRAALVRRLAVSTLRASGAADPAAARDWMSDPDFQVRRLALAVTPSFEPDVRLTLLDRGLQDEHFSVRYAAVQLLAGTPGAWCDRLRPFDPNPHVRLLSIDALGECEGAAPVLDSLAGRLNAGSWHAPAHALVGASRNAPAAATRRIQAFANHDLFFVRMYAARAATNLADGMTLYRLAADSHPNVREVAVRGLSTVVGRPADSVFVQNLASGDYQLVITAANALEGTSHAGARAALMTALDRLSEVPERRETSRDARMAVLQRLREIGGPADSSFLRRYVLDYDPVVAREAARILSGWLERPVAPAPRPLDPLPFPSLSRLAQLAETDVVLHMATGGEIVIRLRPQRAPTNAHRFARLAESGYFDGLTFHRVVPNFVIQGGSPGANEYAGDGPYTRDELTGDPHLRGTVGLSTRGRDTGDAQLFINLVDNYRLDADYTIYGDVVSGMDIVDRVLEGGMISRAELRRRSGE